MTFLTFDTSMSTNWAEVKIGFTRAEGVFRANFDSKII